MGRLGNNRRAPHDAFRHRRGAKRRACAQHPRNKFLAPHHLRAIRKPHQKRSPVMARTTSPLLSLGASGSIGKSIVFGTWKGLSYARQYVVPQNPKTTAQTATRNCL